MAVSDPEHDEKRPAFLLDVFRGSFEAKSSGGMKVICM